MSHTIFFLRVHVSQSHYGPQCEGHIQRNMHTDVQNLRDTYKTRCKLLHHTFHVHFVKCSRIIHYIRDINLCYLCL